MAKDKNDTQTVDALKRRPGRPKSDNPLSNAERQRRHRLRKGKAKPGVSDQAHELQRSLDAYREEAKSLYQKLVAANREVELCRYERSVAFRVADVYRERLEQAGLSTDY